MGLWLFVICSQGTFHKAENKNIQGKQWKYHETENSVRSTQRIPYCPHTNTHKRTLSDSPSVHVLLWYWQLGSVPINKALEQARGPRPPCCSPRCLIYIKVGCRPANPAGGAQREQIRQLEQSLATSCHDSFKGRYLLAKQRKQVRRLKCSVLNCVSLVKGLQKQPKRNYDFLFISWCLCGGGILMGQLNGLKIHHITICILD